MSKLLLKSVDDLGLSIPEPGLTQEEVDARIAEWARDGATSQIPADRLPPPPAGFSGDYNDLTNKPTIPDAGIPFQLDEPENPSLGDLWINGSHELCFYGHELIVCIYTAYGSGSDFHFYDIFADEADYEFTKPSLLTGSTVSAVCAHAHNGKIYTLDSQTNQVVICDLDGSNASAWSLGITDHGTSGPVAIAVNNTRVYVLFSGTGNRNVYLYDHAGNRKNSEGFTLDSNNQNIAGAAIFNSKLYVYDWKDYKLYAYNLDGTRHTSGDTPQNFYIGTADHLATHGDYLYLRGRAYDAEMSRVEEADLKIHPITSAGSFIFRDPGAKWLKVRFDDV